MNNDIKEIREYISCPQFGDNHYGKWGALRLNQRKKIKNLLDYITNLQEKYERLRTELNAKNNIINELEKYLLNFNFEVYMRNGKNANSIELGARLNNDFILNKLMELKENNNG